MASTTAPTTPRPSSQPRTNAGPLDRARGVVNMSTTAMIGTGLSATPIASGRECPIASAMGPLFQPLAALCHHDLNVAVVARVVVGTTSPSPGSSFQDWRPVDRSDAPATSRPCPSGRGYAPPGPARPPGLG